jgi:hypothetical protein
VPLWEKLVGEGVAVKLPESSEFSYRFKYPDDPNSEMTKTKEAITDATTRTARSGMAKFFRHKR